MKIFRHAANAPKTTAQSPMTNRFSFRFLASGWSVIFAASAIEDEFADHPTPQIAPSSAPTPELQLGGQALIEGVMMRSPRFVGAAVRRADGSIQTRVEPYLSITKRHRALGWPLVRGVVGLFEMMLLGTRYLNWSSNLALQDEPPKADKNSAQSTADADSTSQSTADGHAAVSNSLESIEEQIAVGVTSGFNPLPVPELPADSDAGKETQAMPIWAFAGTAALSLMIGFSLFVALPNVLTDWLLGNRTSNLAALNITEGVLKLVIFISYLWAVGRMTNIRRVFEYHGAEHKVVFAAENHRPLTPDGARPFDTPHPRCGTGFALLTVFVSVFCFAWLPWTESHLPRVGMRLLLMPVVAGVSYEILKLTANPRWKSVAIAIMTPGLWLQRLTTRQPDDAQLEVSCEAMKTVIAAENSAA